MIRDPEVQLLADCERRYQLHRAFGSGLGMDTSVSFFTLGKRFTDLRSRRGATWDRVFMGTPWGRRYRDTAWLSVSPTDVHPRMNTCGGDLSAAMHRLRTLGSP